MKKTKYIRLVLITALISSCNRNTYRQRTSGEGQTTDTLSGCPTRWDYDPWYSAFRPLIQDISIFIPSPAYCASLAYSRSGILRGGFGRPFMKSSS
jgi:hypothetical protein